jgi:hypothetical protein
MGETRVEVFVWVRWGPNFLRNFNEIQSSQVGMVIAPPATYYAVGHNSSFYTPCIASIQA